MTKTQLQDIEALLTVLANRLYSDQSDDAVRLLLYRSQGYLTQLRSEVPERRKLRKAS
jgi:hypothetical protein